MKLQNKHGEWYRRPGAGLTRNYAEAYEWSGKEIEFMGIQKLINRGEVCISYFEPRVEKSERQQRKETPMYSGLLAYFPDALAEVAKHSFINNEIHNPGEPLHWSRGKSDDHEDCIIRHMKDHAEAKTLDEKIEAMRAVMWRAGAALQLLCEERDNAVHTP